MNKATIALASIFMLFTSFGVYSAGAQDSSATHKKVYVSTGGEIIFSWADAKVNGMDAKSILRFAPAFNFQTQLHYDLSHSFGLFTGLNLRNVGFIYDDPTVINTRYKMRAYTLGVPLALKIGNMNRTYLFGGYEIEVPICFKEKKFVNEDKVSKSSDWFSQRTPSIYQSAFVGVHIPYGLELKFKYYLTNFVDQDYAANDGNGNVIYPYKDLEAKVFYVSLSLQLRHLPKTHK